MNKVFISLLLSFLLYNVISNGDSECLQILSLDGGETCESLKANDNYLCIKNDAQDGKLCKEVSECLGKKDLKGKACDTLKTNENYLCVKNEDGEYPCKEKAKQSEQQSHPPQQQRELEEQQQQQGEAGGEQQ